MIGYAATTTITISDGETIAAASRRSESPERRRLRGLTNVASAVVAMMLP
jgi:hypothetical protein